MEPNAQLQELFSNPEYSDLTIKPSDGQELRIHKLIVCSNEYFAKLCGAQSHFAESQQKIIQLKDDDPTALKHVLRHLYGFGLPKADRWRFWMNLHVTADKYLIPQLSAAAGEKFCFFVQKRESADEVFDIMETIRNDLSHNDVFVKLAAGLREKHLGKLLGNDRFRAQLDDGGKEALWQQLNELTTKLFFTDKEEKCYALCQQHTASVLQGPVKTGKALCSYCALTRSLGHSSHTTTHVTIKKAWIEK